jgi:hypothetical protein
MDEGAQTVILNDMTRQSLAEMLDPNGQLADEYRYHTDNDDNDPPGESLRLGYTRLTNDTERALCRTIIEETIKAPGKTKVSACWSNLGAINLPNLDLTLSDFQAALMRRANLAGAILRSACLYDTQLPEANLRGANLEGAGLEGANFERADLSYAKLRGARDLDGVKLWRTNLDNAELDMTQLKPKQAIFALGLTAAQRGEVYSQINNWAARVFFTGASYVLELANKIPQADKMLETAENVYHHLQRQR